jgi:RNA-binding protein 5/10
MTEKEVDDFLNSLLENNQSEIRGDPNETLLIHGVPFKTSEEVLEQELIDTRAAFESFNLIKTPSGESRGFVFVKFFSTKLAQNWIQRNTPLYLDGARCRVEYSRPFEREDWKCLFCGCDNFKKREICYVCENVKGYTGEITNCGDNDEGEIESEILLIRGIDKNMSTKEVFTICFLLPLLV